MTRCCLLISFVSRHKILQSVELTIMKDGRYPKRMWGQSSYAQKKSSSINNGTATLRNTSKRRSTLMAARQRKTTDDSDHSTVTRSTNMVQNNIHGWSGTLQSRDFGVNGSVFAGHCGMLRRDTSKLVCLDVKITNDTDAVHLGK